MTTSELTPRAVRVPFVHPLKIEPLGGPAVALQMLSGNLSRDGMFVQTPTPFPIGTRVCLSLESKGQALPFVQGEVVWERPGPSASEAAAPGFGLRFLNYLHPRATELVEQLVNDPDRQIPLVASPSTSLLRRRSPWLYVVAGAGALAAALCLWAAVRAGPAPEPQPVVTVAAEAGIEPSPWVEPAPTTAEAPEAAMRAPIEPDVSPPPKRLSSRLPRGAVRSVDIEESGGRLTLGLELQRGAKMGKSFMLARPPRLVVDVKGATPGRTYLQPVKGVETLQRIRLGGLRNGTRLVFDMNRPIASVQRSNNALTISMVE